MRILIAESLAPGAVKLLQQQPGWEVIVSNPKEYMQHLAGADALIVRSAVTVDKAVLAAAPNLRVIGRAGVGVDNVDLPSATAAGVLVMNTPGGNAVSVAEHALALMLSLARSIPNASASVKSGKWEKTQVHGERTARQNTGSDRPGQHRARGGEARGGVRDADHRSRSVCSFANRERRRGRAGGPADTLSPRAITSRFTPRSRPNPFRLLSRDAFSKMKKGARIINCARGELIDQDALRGGAGFRTGGRRRAGCFRDRTAIAQRSAVRD